MSAPHLPAVGFATPPPLTLHRTWGGGEIVRTGREAAYRQLDIGGGEAHLLRDELAPGASRWRGAAGSVRGVRSLLCLAHVTDLQLADVQSPARFEFFNREFADPRFRDLVPVQRPQEALTAHAVDAMLRTLNRIDAGPVGSRPVDLVVTTGDAIDNAQWNELEAFLALMDGGVVRGRSGAHRYEGVQSVTWPDDVFWRPDGAGPAGEDLFRAHNGFPHLPGLIARALDDFPSAGLRVPWLACFGNHEALIQGVGVVTPEVEAALVGGLKPTRLPPGIDLDRAVEIFISGSHAFLGGDDRPVTPDPSRRPITRAEFVEAHFRSGARPDGHGFTEANRRTGTAYYAYDTEHVRLVALDTTCVAGAADGALDVDQVRWLEERLVEVHSQYETPDGTTVRTGHDDRLVVLFSHHGLDTLTNRRGVRPGVDGSDVVGAPELLRLVHRFPNVVLWLNGHTHTNGVRPRPHPDRTGAGFWEVTTCAVVDWPCQTRIVEIVDAGEGMLALACTMVDHDSPQHLTGAWSGGMAATGGIPVQATASASPHGQVDLAALHRELAANVPWAGLDSPLAGTVADRNVVLPIRAPFPLTRAY
ncbi:MAG: TIGR03767 family metallophosphoesterase [Actinobacteria bacterium]|nr:TIGR03767 family metallophosphoesterase [Actinomycetota bacterium]